MTYYIIKFIRQPANLAHYIVQRMLKLRKC